MIRWSALHNQLSASLRVNRLRRSVSRSLPLLCEALEDRTLLAAPSISNQTFSIDENRAFLSSVGLVLATDPDVGDTLTYQIIGGNPSNAFAINPQTGELIVDNASQINFEANPLVQLQVRVRDQGLASDTAIITININNLNEAPVITNQTLSIPENVVVGTVVGAVTAIDPDTGNGDALTFSIVGGNTGGAFAVDAVTGVITVSNPNAINFETLSSYNLLIQVTDSGGGLKIALWDPQNASVIQNGQTEGIVNNPVIGAIHVVLPHPTNANILYLGGVNGGVWKTTNAQDASPDWIPLTDNMPSLSIGALSFDTGDATFNTLWAGFGRNSSLASTGGAHAGLIRSTDGGATWVVVDGGGTLVGKQISGLAANGNNIVVSVRNGSGGIWRSTNGGATFNQVTTGLPSGIHYDLVFDPLNPSVLYTPIAFAHLTGGTSGIYKSTNGGASWTLSSPAAINNLLGADDAVSNIELATGRSGEVYAGILTQTVFTALFRSGNSGATWTQLDTPTTNENGTTEGLNPGGIRGPGDTNGDGTIDGPEAAALAGGQGAIHFSIVADPNNANIVYLGGDRQPLPFPNSLGAQNFTGRLFRVNATLPAGSQAASLTHLAGVSTLSNSAPHADSREMAFDAAGNLIEGDDGGIYKRTNPQGLGDWFSLNGANLQVTEYHSLRYDTLTNTLVGGTQDAGTAEQLPDGTWQEVNQGDGGKTAIDNRLPTTSLRYTSSQFLGGLRWREIDGAGNVVGQGGVDQTGITALFYTELETNNVVPNGLAIAANNGVFISFDRGQTTLSIGGPSGDGLFGTGLIFGGRTGGVNNPEVVWAGGNTGLFLRSTAGSQLARLNAYPGQTPTDIVVDPNDWQTAIVTDSDQVFRTTDAGANWTDLTGNLVQTQIQTLEYVTGPNGLAAIAIGSIDGVFTMRTDQVGQWREFGANLPNAPVVDLDFDANDGIIAAAPQGRGGWIISIETIFDPTVGDPITVVGQVTVNITNSNEPPTAANQIATIPENRPAGYVVLNSIPASDPDGNGTFTYSIEGGAPAGTFLIDPTNGRISVGDPTYFNFEVNPLTVLNVRVTDSGTPAAFVDITVTVNLTNVNDRPVFNAVAYLVAELAPNGTEVGVLSTVVSDEDVGQTLAYSIMSGNTDGAFAIDAATGQILVVNSAALTPGRVFQVRFRATDSGVPPLNAERLVNITVNSSNHAPVITTGQVFSILEASAINTLVGRVNATDIDAGQTRTFAIIGGNTNGAFSINPATGDLRVANSAALNFVTKPQFTLLIQATDNGVPVLSGSGNVTVNVTNRNDAPVIQAGSFTITEHSRVGSVAGVAKATDADVGQVLTYAIIAGNTQSTFAIEPLTGRITVANKDTLNFETNPTFNLTVRVTDNGSPALSATRVFPIQVRDINERPLVKNRIATIPENRANDLGVAQTIVQDPDAGQSWTYAIVGGNFGNAFKIDAATGVVRVNKSSELNFEGPNPSYVLKIRATDSGTPALFGEGFITVNLTDVNEPATLPTTTFTIQENRPVNTLVGTVVGNNPEPGQTLAYAITAGNTLGAFSINAAGQIRVANPAAVDFETRPKFTLTISMTDNGVPVRVGTGTVIINVTDGEDPPVVTPKTANVRENAPITTFVTKVAASDQDPGDTFSFSIVGGNTSNAFSIDPVTGDIRVNNPTVLNFEGPIPFWDLVVRATDTGNPASFGQATIRVTVTDINEAPNFVNQSFSLPENSLLGTNVGTISASDPDAMQSLTFSIVSGNFSNAFAVNPATGQITVNVPSLIDFETRPVYTLQVRATDDGVPSASKISTVTINLTNQNDAPVVVSLNATVALNSPVGEIVGVVLANDQDGHPVSWQILSGNIGNAFALNPSTGEIKVNSAAALTTPRNYVLNVRATDSGVPAKFGDGQVRITVPAPRSVVPSISLKPKTAVDIWA